MTLTASYAYSEFTFLDDGLADQHDEGNRIPGVPANRLAVGAAWNGTGGFVAFEGRAFDRMFVDDANTATNPPRGFWPLTATFHVRAGTQFRVRKGKMVPFLAVQNVTDARYNSSVVINAAGGRYYEPAPGRTLPDRRQRHRAVGRRAKRLGHFRSSAQAFILRAFPPYQDRGPYGQEPADDGIRARPQRGS